MRLLLVTAACAAAFALPVLADQPTPAASGPANATASTATPASTAPKVDEGVICKMKQITGTRFSKKVCTTQAERDQQAAQGRDLLSGPRADASKPPGG
ncbi:hypothetical protein QO010_000759 [Caulobacter ginsengisoli]|uniref:Phosphate starvation-inducible protein PsiF n=1 Tax=Caulobacter ginsengisoli TaxID=400775 RepID=A0ABU0ILW1_9CAUL|nr:hypothetical protein [Caulobacter ginsengisoli]MDQ0463011.1 hypothetical protein [Caulobacter ginsengisoli]